MHYKDSILNDLANRANVAQFVSFSPALDQRFARIHGFEPNQAFPTAREAANAILSRSSEGSVNVRSFDPTSPKSREFIYGIKNADDVLSAIKRLGADGLHTIVNETIDVCDGGVSGVLLGDVIEFAPCDTPRCVEKPGTAALPRQLGQALLATVYGLSPSLEYDVQSRVEFSLHPLRRGFRQEHTIIWELEEVQLSEATADVRWPNLFSEYIGDKAFGLLIADLLGLPVPATTVIGRGVRPFSFGQKTSSSEIWFRTCPRVQMPGKFTTQRGWTDPFHLMSKEDPSGQLIASVLAQAGIDAIYSGAVIASESAKQGESLLTIEGAQGFGEDFMVGRKKRTAVPHAVRRQVEDLYSQASSLLGPVRFEWVADRKQTWIVQLHRGSVPSYGKVIFPGKPLKYRRFRVENGLEPLRDLVDQVSSTGEGIVLVGDVGITSHFGDVLRRARIPSYITMTGIESGTG
jgi:hypothetical protein